MSDLDLNWIRLVPIATNFGFLKIRFQTRENLLKHNLKPRVVSFSSNLMRYGSDKDIDLYILINVFSLLMLFIIIIIYIFLIRDLPIPELREFQYLSICCVRV